MLYQSPPVKKKNTIGVYRLTDGVLGFQPIPAPTTDQLQALLTRIITRLLKMLTRK